MIMFQCVLNVRLSSKDNDNEFQRYNIQNTEEYKATISCFSKEEIDRFTGAGGTGTEGTILGNGDGKSFVVTGNEEFTLVESGGVCDQTDMKRLVELLVQTVLDVQKKTFGKIEDLNKEARESRVLTADTEL